MIEWGYIRISKLRRNVLNRGAFEMDVPTFTHATLIWIKNESPRNVLRQRQLRTASSSILLLALASPIHQQGDERLLLIPSVLMEVLSYCVACPPLCSCGRRALCHYRVDYSATTQVTNCEFHFERDTSSPLRKIHLKSFVGGPHVADTHCNEAITLSMSESSEAKFIVDNAQSFHWITHISFCAANTCRTSSIPNPTVRTLIAGLPNLQSVSLSMAPKRGSSVITSETFIPSSDEQQPPPVNTTLRRLYVRGLGSDLSPDFGEAMAKHFVGLTDLFLIARGVPTPHHATVDTFHHPLIGIGKLASLRVLHISLTYVDVGLLNSIFQSARRLESLILSSPTIASSTFGHELANLHCSSINSLIIKLRQRNTFDVETLMKIFNECALNFSPLQHVTLYAPRIAAASDPFEMKKLVTPLYNQFPQMNFSFQDPEL